MHPLLQYFQVLETKKPLNNVLLLVFSGSFKISCLHLNFLPKLGKNYENIALHGQPKATTLMADSIRVAQPIRLQHLH